MMKVVKRLISSSARGNNAVGCAESAMAKYARALGFDFVGSSTDLWKN